MTHHSNAAKKKHNRHHNPSPSSNTNDYYEASKQMKKQRFQNFEKHSKVRIKDFKTGKYHYMDQKEYNLKHRMGDDFYDEKDKEITVDNVNIDENKKDEEELFIF